VEMSQVSVLARSEPGEGDTSPSAPTYGGVPDSNYRTLRDTDNVYIPVYGGVIAFAPNDVKITNSTRNTLIGTDEADGMDAAYYSTYLGSLAVYFDQNLLTNFFAGGGNDQFGGSARNDNIWGGTGNDTLYGYAGDDKVYGEEGSDYLPGHDGLWDGVNTASSA
jgi:Ca2+-binding RTX toxin-like protein